MIFAEKKLLLKDQTPCVLRSPKKEDAQKAIAFLKAVCGQSPYLLRYPEEANMTVKEEEAFFERYNQNPQALMLMAFIQGEIASLASFASSPLMKTRHRASLAISVDQKYWGLGLGTHMVNHLCQKAKEVGVTQMELEFIEGNERGRTLYEKCGFTEYGQRPSSIRLKDGTLLGEKLMMKAL